jgi:hypothetical protein
VSYDHRPSCAFRSACVVVHHVCCSFEYVINNGWVGTGMSHLCMYVCVSYVNVVFQFLWWWCWFTLSMSILESLSTDRQTERHKERECVCECVCMIEALIVCVAEDVLSLQHTNSLPLCGIMISFIIWMRF